MCLEPRTTRKPVCQARTSQRDLVVGLQPSAKHLGASHIGGKGDEAWVRQAGRRLEQQAGWPLTTTQVHRSADLGVSDGPFAVVALWCEYQLLCHRHSFSGRRNWPWWTEPGVI